MKCDVSRLVTRLLTLIAALPVLLLLISVAATSVCDTHTNHKTNKQ